jgi:hypothetical protein
MRAFFILFFLGAGLWAWGPLSLAQAQTLSPGSNEANPLDAANPFARSQALGSAFVGVADDGTALFSNPAGLAGLSAPELLADTDLWLVGSFEQTLLWTFPAGKGLGLGVAGQYLGFGSIPGFDNSGASTGTYGADRLNLKIGGGVEFLPGWNLGADLEVDRDRVDQTGAGNFSVGVGFLGRLSPQAKIGLSFDHAGILTAGESLLTQTRLGVSYLLPLGGSQTLLTALGGELDSGSDSFVQLGMEYNWAQTLFVRLGYQGAIQDQGLGGLTGLTAGAGAEVGGFRLDYAYSPYGDLGSAHRVTVGYLFQPPLPTPTPTPFYWPPPPMPPSAGDWKEGPGPAPTPSISGSDSLSVQSSVVVDPLAAGEALEKAGKYTQAMELYQFFLKDQPANAGLWEAMGNLYARFHRNTDAAVCFKRALDLKPGDPRLSQLLQSVGGNRDEK